MYAIRSYYDSFDFRKLRSVTGPGRCERKSMNHSDEIRSFIAIPLPDKVKEVLSEKITYLKNIIPNNSLKWVQVNNIHLTLKFLGNVTKADLQEFVITSYSIHYTKLYEFHHLVS